MISTTTGQFERLLKVSFDRWAMMPLPLLPPMSILAPTEARQTRVHTEPRSYRPSPKPVSISSRCRRSRAMAAGTDTSFLDAASAAVAAA